MTATPEPGSAIVAAASSLSATNRRALADLRPSTTYLRDLALVCSNCHRMIDRSRPWLTVEEAHFLLV